MRTTLLGLTLCLSLTVHAQRECASSQYTSQQRVLQPATAKAAANVEAFVQQQLKNSTQSRIVAGTAVIRIPVVVHVLYNSPDQNISDAQIRSQIEVLNRDFRRANTDAVNTPDRFKALAADVEIEFALATADPKGRPTTGIVRKQTGVIQWVMDDKIKSSADGGDNAWDTKNYLNIWIGPLRKLLGYASEPGGPADKDGVVITPTAFGTVNVAAPYHLGRTAVHEVGHWMGLRHIWGDANCGDDLVDDTPKQSTYTTGCPSGIVTSCNNGANGNMYMNFMDFTDDACMNLFTQGQKARMRALFNPGGPRYSLVVSPGLDQPWAKEGEVEAAPVADRNAANVSLFPNPATTNLVVNFTSEAWIGSQVQVLSLNGVVLQQLTITSLKQAVSLTGLNKGVYFIQAMSTAGKFNSKFVKL